MVKKEGGEVKKIIEIYQDISFTLYDVQEEVEKFVKKVAEIDEESGLPKKNGHLVIEFIEEEK